MKKQNKKDQDDTGINNEIIEFVTKSSHRTNILQILQIPIIPRTISDITNMPLSHVSKALSELASMNLIECINPNVKKGKLYQRTALGDQFMTDYLDKLFAIKEGYSKSK